MQEGVVAELFGGGRIGDGGRGNEVLAVGQRGVQQRERGRADLAGGNGAAIAVLDGVDDAVGAAVAGEAERHGDALGGLGGVHHADALVGAEVEELVLLDGAADCAAELVAVEERHLGGDGGRSVVEEGRRIHVAVLELLVDHAVDLIGSGLGDHADVGAAVGSLGGVVHGRVDGDFLDGLDRRSGQRLADGVVDGDALDGAARAETLAGVEHEAILAHLAGRVSVEQVVGADAIERKTVAGIALPVGENSLVAEAGIGSAAADEIGMHAGTQNGQLRETAGGQRSLLNSGLLDHVAVGRIDLVHQGDRRHFHRGGHRAHLQVAVDGGGAV